MWLVKMTIPGDRFFDAMQDVSGWLAEKNLETSNFSFARDAAGQVKFRISFAEPDDADRFAERFDGRVLTSDCPG